MFRELYPYVTESNRFMVKTDGYSAGIGTQCSINGTRGNLVDYKIIAPRISSRFTRVIYFSDIQLQVSS